MYYMMSKGNMQDLNMGVSRRKEQAVRLEFARACVSRSALVVLPRLRAFRFTPLRGTIATEKNSLLAEEHVVNDSG
jgi:hypothetical protein